MIWGAARRRARVDAAVAAYTQWRSERDAVRAAYRVWSAAGAFGEPLAFETYLSRIGWRACRRSRERGSAMRTKALDRPQRLATGGASSPRTAFVPSGGAGLGALQVGMLAFSCCERATRG
jgi:hypothetical protein